MGIYIGALGALISLACFLDIYRRRNQKSEEQPVQNPESMVCCGKHEVCEKQRLIDAMAKKAQYFEDEELDRFKGYASGSYTDEEAEEFRYVMYTMKQEEVLSWLESLQVREVQLPDQLKDEAYMLIEDNPSVQ